MNQPPGTPVRGLNGKPSAGAMARLDRRWRPRYLLLAPHRLGFFLAMAVLVAAGAWWALVHAGAHLNAGLAIAALLMAWTGWVKVNKQ